MSVFTLQQIRLRTPPRAQAMTAARAEAVERTAQTEMMVQTALMARLVLRHPEGPMWRAENKFRLAAKVMGNSSILLYRAAPWQDPVGMTQESTGSLN